jgi:hypothetical protein
MTEDARQAQIIAASHYVIVALLFATEDHGMQLRSKTLSWLRLFADFLETKQRPDQADEKIDAMILRSLIGMVEGLPTGDGGGSRRRPEEVIRALFQKAA